MKTDIEPLIIYEDTHILVCRKPAGVPAQSARIGMPDMESLLKSHLAAGRTSDRNRHGKAPYLAVIHRLDQPVSGLLVFAKTPAAAKGLNRQLTSSGFGKYYRAVVTGTPDPADGCLENYIVKDGRSNTSRICSKDTPGARFARLYYRTVSIYTDSIPSRDMQPDVQEPSAPAAASPCSLVDIRLDTGRHHQIRVQMAHLGCPLVGDRKYGGTSQSSVPDDSIPGVYAGHAPRLMLCAYKLEFTHPANGRRMSFLIPEPEQFA